SASRSAGLPAAAARMTVQQVDSWADMVLARWRRTVAAPPGWDAAGKGHDEGMRHLAWVAAINGPRPSPGEFRGRAFSPLRVDDWDGVEARLTACPHLMEHHRIGLEPTACSPVRVGLV